MSQSQKLPAMPEVDHLRPNMHQVLLSPVNQSHNVMIALAIQPKGKGWAWERKQANVPIDFAASHNFIALSNWVGMQPWWAKPVSDIDPTTLKEHYIFLVNSMYAENTAVFRAKFRNLAAAACRQKKAI